MHRDERAGLRAYRFDSLPADRVDALVSTRLGGVSEGDHASLNVGLRGGDDPARVLANRERLFSAYGLPLERSVWCRQVHGAAVTVVDAPGPRGAYGEDDVVADSDALVTDLAGVPLCIKVADCVPVLLHDPEHQALAVVHAGWRGTVARIGSRTVETLAARYGTDPAALRCAVGPSIGPDAFEVGEDVIAPAREAYGEAVLRDLGGGKALLDLWEANVTDLTSAGVPRERIEVSGISTSDRLDEFYSHRFETRGGQRETGRLAMIAMLH
jgi:YfiH family protein